MDIFINSSELMNPISVREILKYEPDTGKLFWKRRAADTFIRRGVMTLDAISRGWNSRYSGSEAFTCVSKGYKTGAINGRTLKASRVIWAIYYGIWPDAFIDHIDRNRANNQISNLRECTKQQNSFNTSRIPGSSSEFLGVYWHRDRKKWCAQIGFNGKTRHLGVFEDEKEAASAYDIAAFDFYGEFANLNLCQDSHHEI